MCESIDVSVFKLLGRTVSEGSTERAGRIFHTQVNALINFYQRLCFTLVTFSFQSSFVSCDFTTLVKKKELIKTKSHLKYDHMSLISKKTFSGKRFHAQKISSSSFIYFLYNCSNYIFCLLKHSSYFSFLCTRSLLHMTASTF